MSSKKNQIPEDFSFRLGLFIEKAYGGKQIRFVEKTGIKSGPVSEYLSRKYLPGFEQLTRMAEKTELDLNWLLTGAGNMFREKEAPPREPPDTSLEGVLALLQMFAQNPRHQRDILSKVKEVVRPAGGYGKRGKPNPPGKGRLNTKLQS